MVALVSWLYWCSWPPSPAYFTQFNKESIMQKNERSPESSQNSMTRRHFMGTVMIGFAGTCLCVSCGGSSDSVPHYDTTGVYKNLFNTCNSHQGHLAPPDGETVAGEKFEPVMVFFQSVFRYPTNAGLIRNEFPLFLESYETMCEASPDILAMIFQTGFTPGRAE